MMDFQLSAKCAVPEEWRDGIGEFGLWVRPAKMFFEEIEIDGRRIRRFERV